MTGSKNGSYLLATFEGGGSVAPFVTVARKLMARGPYRPHHERFAQSLIRPVLSLFLSPG